MEIGYAFLTNTICLKTNCIGEKKREIQADYQPLIYALYGNIYQMFCGNDEKKKEAKAILADLYAVYGNVYKMLRGNDEKKKKW